MKGFVVGLIVLGGVCLVGGAAILAYGMAKGNINDNFVTNEYKLDGDIDGTGITLCFKLATSLIPFFHTWKFD